MKNILIVVVALFLVGGCSSHSSRGAVEVVDEAVSGPPGVPELSRWEAQMKTFGEKNCQAIKMGAGDFDHTLMETYYDAEWVFYRIADYTGDSKWHDCAQAAERVYRDKYVLANKGNIPGYWNFSRGIAEDFLRTGDSKSKEAVIQLAERAAFVRENTPAAETENFELSREVAYGIQAYLNAEDVGEPRRARLDLFVNQALDHIDQWFVSKSASYIKPFMVGLTAQALIAYRDHVDDPRVLPALITAADGIWDQLWRDSAQAFLYISKEVPNQDPPNPTPDVNLLITPLYGWLYHQTGDPRFAERGDKIFAGGVRQAYLEQGKQFNQSYRWSFDYLRWRTEAPLARSAR